MDQTFIVQSKQLASNTSLGSFFNHMEVNVLCVSLCSVKLFSMASIVWLFGICSLFFVSCGYVAMALLLTMLSVI